jgi:hypothetical protein
MNTFAKRTLLGALIAWGLLPAVNAANSPNEVPGKSSRVHWTLSTADTRIKISVSNNGVYIDSFQNPAQAWDWVPERSEVPLPGKNSIRTAGTGISTMQVDQTPNWTYVGASEDKTGGYIVTLRFTCTTPALELKSVWIARPGPGPVENQVTIQNKSGG